MAVTVGPVVIRMTANGDHAPGKMFVQALHATGNVEDITDSYGNPIASFFAEQNVEFPCKLKVDGVRRGAGAGVLYIYLV